MIYDGVVRETKSNPYFQYYGWDEWSKAIQLLLNGGFPIKEVEEIMLGRYPRMAYQTYGYGTAIGIIDMVRNYY